MKKKDITYRVSSTDGMHLCDASFQIRLYSQRDGQIEGLVYMVLSSAVPNSAGIKTKDEFSFGWRVEDIRARAWVDMVISEQLRNWGIGTFIWYVVYENLPEYLKDRFIVCGKLSPLDQPEPGNRFWKKILCFDSDPQFKFNLKKSGWVFFRESYAQRSCSIFLKFKCRSSNKALPDRQAKRSVMRNKNIYRPHMLPLRLRSQCE